MCRLFFKWVCISSLLLGGCKLPFDGDSKTSEPLLSGGGVQTTNGDVLGRVRLADAIPAEGVQVKLSRVFLSAKPNPYYMEWAGFSDSAGKYLFEKVPSGRYAMSVLDNRAGTMAILPRLKKTDEGFFALDAVLAPWVTLIGRALPLPGISPEQIKVCVPGMSACISPGPDSIYVIPHAPQGSYDLVFIQGKMARYLAIQISRINSDTIYLKDIILDSNTIKSNCSLDFYESDLSQSCNVVPATYFNLTEPTWYKKRNFAGAKYFLATSENQYEQWDIEDYLEWSQFRTIHLPSYVPDSGSMNALVDLPYLLRLNLKILFSQSGSGGKDLRLSRGNGLHLPYYIETWDSAGSQANVWVWIDKLYPKLSVQDLAIHWGNANAEDRSESNAAQGPNPQIRSIWSLNDSALTTLVKDLGGNFPAYFLGGKGREITAPHSTSGMIAGALQLDGIANMVVIDPHPKLSYPQFTLMIWAKNDVARPGKKEALILKGENGKRLWGLLLDSQNKLQFSLWDANNKLVASRRSLGAVPNLDSWHLYSVTFQSGMVRIYLDGQEMLSENLGIMPKAILTGDSRITLGGPEQDDFKFWQGSVDNFVYDKEVRSPDFIQKNYENQFDSTR